MRQISFIKCSLLSVHTYELQLDLTHLFYICLILYKKQHISQKCNTGLVFAPSKSVVGIFKTKFCFKKLLLLYHVKHL